MAGAEPSAERYEQRELAAAVKWLQKQGARDAEGRPWTEWLQSFREPGAPAPPLDPRRQSSEVLEAFVGAVPAEARASARSQLKRARRGRLAFARLQRALGPSAKAAADVIGLVQHTRAHMRFWENYAALPSHEDGWVVAPTPPSKPSGAAGELKLVAIDCEMVATAEDDGALARVCVCDEEGKMLLDRLVRPEADPTDLRTEITGITAEELRAVSYSRSDAQRDVLRLMGPLTVVVGHTLHKDLAALRLDALLVLDVGLLYGLEGFPSRMPPLAHLVDQVLGRSGFRGADGRSAHNCADDVVATMELCKQRIRQCVEDAKVRAIVWVPPPQVGANLDEKEARELLVHRLPDRPGMVMAVMSMFASVKGATADVEGVDLRPASARAAAQVLRSVRVLFRTREDAEQAYEMLPAVSEGTDSAGRPQKLVSLGGLLPEAAAEVYVRLPAPAAAAAAAGGGKPGARADAAGVPAAAGAATRWRGWKRCADDELRAAGGELPWRRLRDALVARSRASCPGAAALDEEELRLRALACLPEGYLSSDSELVRAPKRRKGAQAQ
ncbi:unnamed protein product [Prorocentrum cordatum]|uniref:Exonuclease domain-containing protein n=1 Tax=Prorocentrum cordatum TaxID=2364126 RepID=A0ABN9XGY7_9DINO|nr:unnamed protein product [Polarella glacialis]